MVLSLVAPRRNPNPLLHRVSGGGVLVEIYHNNIIALVLLLNFSIKLLGNQNN